jgi:hypothetical protein
MAGNDKAQTIEQVLANTLPVFRKYCLERLDPQWHMILRPLLPDNSVDFLATLLDLRASRQEVIRKWYQRFQADKSTHTPHQQASLFLEECFVGVFIPTLVWKGLEARITPEVLSELDQKKPLKTGELAIFAQYLMYFLEVIKDVKLAVAAQ